MSFINKIYTSTTASIHTNTWSQNFFFSKPKQSATKSCCFLFLDSINEAFIQVCVLVQHFLTNFQRLTSIFTLKSSFPHWHPRILLHLAVGVNISLVFCHDKTMPYARTFIKEKKSKNVYLGWNFEISKSKIN